MKILNLISLKTKIIIISVFLLFFSESSKAQIEWASRAKDLGDTLVTSFEKLLGLPDSYLEEEKSDYAWTAYFKSANDTREILVHFDNPIPVRKIFVVENYGIGLKDIYLIDEQGVERSKYSLNQNFDFNLNIISKISHVTLYEPTDYKVQSLRIVVYEPFSVSEVCQIDAIGISSEDIHYLFPPRNVIARRQLAAKFPFTLNYQLLDHENQEPLADAQVVITDLLNQSKDTLVTDHLGRIVKHLNHSKFSLDVSREGYFVGKEIKFSTMHSEKGKVFEHKVPIRRFQPGKSFVFYGLFKSPGSIELNQYDEKILEKMLKTLKANPYSVVSLKMHTDSRGKDDFNLKITQKRADALVNYFEGMGIPKERMQPLGLGETQLANECSNGVLCDSKKHLANRRLVVEVVDYIN